MNIRVQIFALCFQFLGSKCVGVELQRYLVKVAGLYTVKS